MRILSFFALLVIVPGICDAATRPTTNARLGVSGNVTVGSRMPSMTTKIGGGTMKSSGTGATIVSTGGTSVSGGGSVDTGEENPSVPEVNSANCREVYRQCMDDFCLLDESEGYRCACSDNINKSKSLIQEIQKIQDEADKLYTEGVEREQLGAKAAYVFGESERAQSSSRTSGISFSDWLNGNSSGDDDSLGGDADIGSGLYSMAANYCEFALEACGDKAEMEEMLYSRQVVQDCKGFETYLAEQKRNAQANKRTAEKAVRTARAEMMSETQKYNRGTCLLAYKSCIADKGGCGANFENCLDESLLARRAHACDNILEQCTAVKDYVLKDWKEEAEYVLEQAAVYSDRNQRLTCNARIESCLEEGCSLETNPLCLSDINIAAGICPVIEDCNNLIPGIKDSVKDKLGFLRVRFCQNDVDKCLRDKCGDDFTNPACLGKNTQTIVDLCPKSMFPSCKNEPESEFEVIVNAILLQLDYQMLQGCVNYFSTELGKVCGTDMACLPSDSAIDALTQADISNAKTFDKAELKKKIRENAVTAVNDFFKKFEKETTVAACTSSTGSNLGKAVFQSAKMTAEFAAVNRSMRELDTKLGKLVRAKNLKDAEAKCLETFPIESKPAKSTDKGSFFKDAEPEQSYSYINRVVFEPELSNCKVCRMQRNCEVGGESKASSALTAASGGLTAGASMGTMVSPGWGTAIGGIVGAVGAGAMGLASGGRESFCRENEVCQDINIEVIPEEI